jgi:hypothetical protein
VLPKLLTLHFITLPSQASRVFAREGEDVEVACSRQEKDEAVDCLF